MAAALPMMLAVLQNGITYAAANPLTTASALAASKATVDATAQDGFEGWLRQSTINGASRALPNLLANGIQTARDAVGLSGDAASATESAHHLMQTLPGGPTQVPGDGLDSAIKDAAAAGAPAVDSGITHHLAPIPGSPNTSALTDGIRSGIPGPDKLGSPDSMPGKSMTNGPDALSRMLGNAASSAIGNAITPTATPGAPSGGGATSFSAPARVGGGPGGSSGLPITNSTAPKIYPWVVPNDSRRIGV